MTATEEEQLSNLAMTWQGVKHLPNIKYTKAEKQQVRQIRHIVAVNYQQQPWRLWQWAEDILILQLFQE